MRSNTTITLLTCVFLCSCNTALRSAETPAQAKRTVKVLEAGRKQHIVCYGTSLTSNGAWVKQLNTELSRRYPGLVTVTNSGGSGKYSKWGVENLKQRVIDKKPDVVLIEFAMNDAVNRFHCSVPQARANLESMIDRIGRSLPRCRIVLQVMNPVVGKSAASRPHLESYYQMYRDVAAKRKLLLIDHGPKWKAVLVAGEDDFRKVVPDGVHPTADGYRKHVTPAILAALTP